MKEIIEENMENSDEYYSDSIKYLRLYQKKIGDPIPLMHVMGSAILREKFYGSTEALYDYCLEHNKTWEEVLGYVDNPNVMY